MSFAIGDSQRYKEGILKKRSGGRFKQENRCLICNCGKLCRAWSKKWFIVTSDFIAYLAGSEYSTIHELLIFDPSFKVEYGRKVTGHDHAILIKNSSRSLLLKAENEEDQKIWVEAINEAFLNSDWHPRFKRRFDSFAPERQNNLCRWFVDGEGYFAAVYRTLMSASRDVYITDWWLTPKLYLKRPVSLDKNGRNEESRLDLVLKQLVNMLL
jgi:phospholipase D1/2